MAANNDPQPSTSNGAPQQNGGGELIRSATSTMAPLTEAELAYIKKDLGSSFGVAADNAGR